MAPADLFAPRMQPPVAPNGRREPRLWVRRLAIFEDPQTIRRDIRLKPGLNIVWTPDMSNSGQPSLAHGSGKTTFCRLLRACLGEPDFAIDTQRTRLMVRLPNGLVSAEVIVDGTCWVVVRTLGLGSNSFVAQTDSIEDALARGRREGDPTTIDAIVTKAFFSSLIGRSPQEVGDDHIWDVLRAWLSRDQECRLADILSWRTTKTQTRSRAQTLSETAKLTMVRLALRALDAEEQQAAARERELASAADEERKQNAYSEQRRAEKFRSLRNALGVGEDVGLDDTLEQKGLVSLAEASLAEAMRANVPQPPDVGALFDRLADLNAQRAAKVEERQTQQSDAEKKRIEAEYLRSEASQGEIDISQGRIRVCTICRVPVDEVLANGCGISLERCDVDAIRTSISEKQTKATELDRDAEGAELEARRMDALIQQIDQQIRITAGQAENADATLRAAQQAAATIQDRVYRARRLLDDARALRQSDTTARPVFSATDEQDAVRKQMEQGRKRAQQAIGALEERYRGIVSAWLPDGIDGSIKLDGKGLRVDAQFSGRGEVSTAALDSLKIVAFDLAAMHLAVEEKADLPAFLIHDSPREADLDGALYARLFERISSVGEQIHASLFPIHHHDNDSAACHNAKRPICRTANEFDAPDGTPLWNGPMTIEAPQSFVVREECQKVAWQNGYRRAMGEFGGWARYGSTTAKGTIWLAAGGHEGPWFLALDHAGILEELNLPQADLPGPGLARYAWPSLSALYAVMPRVYQLGVTLPDGPLEEFRAAVAGLPKTTEAERLIIQRVGQDIFRDRLMTYWQGRCPLTGITDPALLRASHIIAWKDCASDAERLDVHNGLLLSALWDAAFDRGLVTFDDEGRPEFSPKLSEAGRAELRWHATILLTDKHRARLVWHRTETFDGSVP